MKLTDGAIVIVGSPVEKFNEAQAAQFSPFVWVQSNGWNDGDPADFTSLLEDLKEWKLDYKMFRDEFVGKNPCHWAYGDQGKGEPRFVDGPRMFEAEVTTFFGNFEGLSHVFNIYTNHQPLIQVLSEAIEANRVKFGGM